VSALIRWLAESKPDVACLQELKAPQEKFPEAAIREAGYGVIWHGQKSWNGGRDSSRVTKIPSRSVASCPAIQKTCTAAI